MILPNLYKRMDVKDKLFISLLILVASSEESLAKKSVYNRQPQISCRYLRHVYRFLWYKPQCSPDGSIKNPLCFNSGRYLRICCCTYKKAVIVRAIKWIGQCATYAAKSTALPVCNGPTMVRKYAHHVSDSKVKEDTRKSKERHEAEEQNEGEIMNKGDTKNKK